MRKIIIQIKRITSNRYFYLSIIKPPLSLYDMILYDINLIMLYKSAYIYKIILVYYKVRIKKI